MTHGWVELYQRIRFFKDYADDNDLDGPRLEVLFSEIMAHKLLFPHFWIK